MKSVIGIVLAATVLHSCNRVMPSGFWMSYKSELIRDDVSDQGPWGGHYAISWQGNSPDEFEITDVTEFAEENGWVLLDKWSLGKSDLDDWIRYNGEKVFPVNYEGVHFGTGGATLKEFPRWIDQDLELMRFKTPWIVVEPETADSMDAYGYVLISKRGDAMSVYHKWGE